MIQLQLENVMVGFVAFLHLLFLILEMFLWNNPTGRKVLGLKQDYAKQTATLAANQGLYNGFLAAGLIWSFLNEAYSVEIRVFFLSCIILAGIFGALTVNRIILWIQALPATIAIMLVLI